VGTLPDVLSEVKLFPVFVGFTDGPLLNQSTNGGSDAFLAKYDQFGAVVWARTWYIHTHSLACAH